MPAPRTITEFRDQETDAEDRPWRPAGSGNSFVYVLPCRDEDILKLGMSRDPLDRFQSLHQRYYDFFDFDEALLVETDSVREARAIELRLGRLLKVHSAPAPLLVSQAAGGGTEWYRGALGTLTTEAILLGNQGHIVHRPLREWLRLRLQERGSLFYHWSSQMLDAIELEWNTMPPAGPLTRLERTLRNGLDAFAAFGLPVEPLVPMPVLRWRNEERVRLLP